MAEAPALTAKVRRIAGEMEAFEASESVANTGTGARREGAKFELLLAGLWREVVHLCGAAGASSTELNGDGSRWYCRLRVEERELILPLGRREERGPATRWLETHFDVTQLVTAYPGMGEAVARYAPSTGPFAAARYPGMFDGLSTRFDDTIVLVKGDILQEKILLEYKTAKSSKGVQIDANVHERLSFQMMQYLEAATRYPRCSLVVFANGAFVRYRNKYHVNFHVQADRLANFRWFSMEHACTASEYTKFVEGLIGWLFCGRDREQEKRR